MIPLIDPDNLDSLNQLIDGPKSEQALRRINEDVKALDGADALAAMERALPDEVEQNYETSD